MSRHFALICSLLTLAYAAGATDEIKPLAPSLPWERKFIEKLQTKVTCNFTDVTANKMFVYLAAQSKTVKIGRAHV